MKFELVRIVAKSVGIVALMLSQTVLGIGIDADSLLVLHFEKNALAGR